MEEERRKSESPIPSNPNELPELLVGLKESLNDSNIHVQELPDLQETNNTKDSDNMSIDLEFSSQPFEFNSSKLFTTAKGGSKKTKKKNLKNLKKTKNRKKTRNKKIYQENKTRKLKK